MAVRPSLYRRGTERGESFSRNYLSGVAGVQGGAAEQRLRKKPSMGQKVGGWLYGRWTGPSIAEEPASASGSMIRHAGAADARSVSSGAKTIGSNESGKVAAPVPIKPRPPGVNQLGPIFGFGPEPATPYRAILEPSMVNEEALREGLMDGG